MTLSYLMAAPALWLLAVVEYLIFSHGATVRGTARAAVVLAVSSVAAVLPMAVAGAVPPVHSLALAGVSAFAYQLVYPLMRNVDRRTRGVRATYAADPATGMCVFGLLCGMLLLGGAFEWIVGPVELALVAVVITQVVYYLLYGSGMDAYGFRLMTQTNTNEVIEFVRYYPLWLSASLVCVFAGVIAAAVWSNLPAGPYPPAATVWKLLGSMALCAGLLLAGGRRGVLARSGFAGFYLAKRDNTRRLRAYPAARAERERGIDAELLGRPYEGPSTIVLVIGESANRDYMSAFVPGLERDTTPWLRGRHEADPRHWMLYGNAYSCGMHTFVALEQGLTEANQKAPDGFVCAASIVDMARAAGRRVHWYSNQGHLGASMSQVSVVADEADEAMWTVQTPGMPPYDAELLPMLDRVDPKRDNFVVLHLKGNHFSFENRYPAEAERWKPAGAADSITTYMNSIHYVDDLLRQVWEYGAERLNMKAMVYCSDHAIIPDCHRSPTFAGFGDVRIPLAVWTSEDFARAHPERHESLLANRDRYWTNDFLYDLMCGLMDVRSPRFDVTNSLAHKEYAHSRESLTILGGTVAVADDAL